MNIENIFLSIWYNSLLGKSIYWENAKGKCLALLMNRSSHVLLFQYLLCKCALHYKQILNFSDYIIFGCFREHICVDQLDSWWVFIRRRFCLLFIFNQTNSHWLIFPAKITHMPLMSIDVNLIPLWTNTFWTHIMIFDVNYEYIYNFIVMDNSTWNIRIWIKNNASDSVQYSIVFCILYIIELFDILVQLWLLSIIKIDILSAAVAVCCHFINIWSMYWVYLWACHEKTRKLFWKYVKSLF